jgi:penicillin-binding protein 2
MSAIERGRGPREPRLPVSPQLAFRVAIIGGVAMIMFGVIFFRLWYLQVLSGEQYVQQANANRVRELPIPAPRGKILDRQGQLIVASLTTNEVQVVPSQMSAAVAEQVAAYRLSLAPAEKLYRESNEAVLGFERTHTAASLRRASAAQLKELGRLRARALAAIPRVPVPQLPRAAVRAHDLFARLGHVIGVSARAIDERVVQGMLATPYANVTVKTDAGPGALTVLGERQAEFPGVVQEPVSIRGYPYGEMSAQVLGYVGQISEPELTKSIFRGVRPGTVVGQEGLEFYYDHYLRGQPGVQYLGVNAAGQSVPSRKAPAPPHAGYSLKVTLDLGLQRESEKALLEGIEHARASGKLAPAGGFVALDPRNGEVLALGSYPGFNPNLFAKPLSQRKYEELKGSGTLGGPLTDRTVNGTYPTGSTFKPITAMAALEAGVINPSQGLGAGSCISVSTEQFCNAGHADYGAVGLVEALKVSSDTYFFETGQLAYYHGGNVIQNMARKLGIGHTTGIDLPSEIEGVVPGPKWRERMNETELKCRAERHVPSCGFVAEIAPWRVGDNMHLAVGQGDLLTDPLQMAVAYSTLANAFVNGGDGTVVTPHLGKEIDDARGGLVQSLSFPSHRVHLNSEDVNLVMQGIHEAASQAGGTSAAVWSGWNQSEHPVYGKTGTAQHTFEGDQSWYMCYIGDPQRPIVIAVTVEQGGFGAETAAPIARLMASQWFGKPKKFVAGNSPTF